MKTVRDLATELEFELPDCQDNSCYFGSTGGMRTNGGCRCADHIIYDKPHTLSRVIQKLCILIKNLNTRVEILEKNVNHTSS